MKVSIIIPVYNVERYIQRCLESVVAQQVNDVEIECILVDDCSTDGTMNLVRAFVDSYRGAISFVLLTHDRNRGPSAARNTGIDASSGDYIFYMDSDDRISQDCISRLTAVLAEHPQADFVMGNIFHAKDQTSYMSENGPVLVIDTQEELFRRLFDMKIPNSACNRLIRREVLQRNQMRFTEGMLYEDLFWNYQFFLVIHYIVLLPDVTYIYEDNEGSIVNTTISRQNVVAESFCHITDEILSHMPPCLHTNALMYAITILLKAIDVQILYDCNADVEQHIRRSRKQLMATLLRSGRLLSALFALLMYKPFSYLLQRAFMRRIYHRMSMMTTRIENVVDKVFSRK